jgi:hypothetical protein
MLGLLEGVLAVTKTEIAERARRSKLLADTVIAVLRNEPEKVLLPSDAQQLIREINMATIKLGPTPQIPPLGVSP